MSLMSLLRKTVPIRRKRAADEAGRPLLLAGLRGVPRHGRKGQRLGVRIVEKSTISLSLELMEKSLKLVEKSLKLMLKSGPPALLA